MYWHSQFLLLHHVIETLCLDSLILPFGLWYIHDDDHYSMLLLWCCCLIMYIMYSGDFNVTEICLIAYTLVIINVNLNENSFNALIEWELDLYYKLSLLFFFAFEVPCLVLNILGCLFWNWQYDCQSFDLGIVESFDALL